MTTMPLTERGSQLALNVQVLETYYVTPMGGMAPYYELVVGWPDDPPTKQLHLLTRDDRIYLDARHAEQTGLPHDIEYRHVTRTDTHRSVLQALAIWRSA